MTDDAIEKLEQARDLISAAHRLIPPTPNNTIKEGAARMAVEKAYREVNFALEQLGFDKMTRNGN